MVRLRLRQGFGGLFIKEWDMGQLNRHHVPDDDRTNTAGYRIIRWRAIMRCEYSSRCSAHLTPALAAEPAGSAARQIRTAGPPSGLLRHASRLVIGCRRYHCVACGRTFVQPLPGILPGRHSTEPLREHLYLGHDDGSAPPPWRGAPVWDQPPSGAFMPSLPSAKRRSA